ncbi:hypothetical protein HO173_011568 [Letharia columbiana]|uniref:Uncharacterized protein n=1 Tax=Letharia columbiana TaxID=112416 RepID=A0A8H6KZ24_9LECA|nr:uncharacterized protein HO173_011568 [Letharia columbiana]KAF6229528.1 hypothetical protein HO173_011568 [Letharia columbiana]
MSLGVIRTSQIPTIFPIQEKQHHLPLPGNSNPYLPTAAPAAIKPSTASKSGQGNWLALPANGTPSARNTRPGNGDGPESHQALIELISLSQIVITQASFPPDTFVRGLLRGALAPRSPRSLGNPPSGRS